MERTAKPNRLVTLCQIPGPFNCLSANFELVEKDVHRTDRMIPLFAGEDIPHPDPDSPFADTGTNVHLEQMKDMLLTYNEYNPNLGYVQGMSDLLAPIYAVMQDDAVAFWAFVCFMERMVRYHPIFPSLCSHINRNRISSGINLECVHNSLLWTILSNSWTPNYIYTSSQPKARISSFSSECF